MTPAEQMREAAAQVCEDERRRTDLRLKRAREDLHTSEIQHQEGRWHALMDAEEAISRLPLPADPVRDALVEALKDAAAQIVYFHEKFQKTGTGETTLMRINAALKLAGEKP